MLEVKSLGSEILKETDTFEKKFKTFFPCMGSKIGNRFGHFHQVSYSSSQDFPYRYGQP